MTRLLAWALLIACSCSDPRAAGTASSVPAPTPVAAVVDAAAPDAAAVVETPWQLRCLAKHYAGAEPIHRSDTRAMTDGAGYAGTMPMGLGDGWWLRVGGAMIPWDDGVARSGDDRLDRPDARDVFEPAYPRRAPLTAPSGDPGRARLEPLFVSTYGTPKEAGAALVTVQLAGQSVRIHRKVAPALERVAARMHAAFSRDASLRDYFTQMGGTYNDRDIAGTERKSAHAYGIAIDIGTARADYWRNAGTKAGDPPPWKNRIPEAIVRVFEDEGFVWGGRWAHYDTMHFEYRPELFDASCTDSSGAPSGAGPASTSSVAPSGAATVAPPPERYAWKDEPGALPAVDTLHQRFTPPAGTQWELPEQGSFGAFLLGLPLAAKDTPVRSYRGDVLVPAGDPRLAAVTTVDVGTQDLQQCADAVIRMHAEYNFDARRDDKLTYRAVSKFEMPYARWLAGDRPVAQGNDLAWSKGKPSARSHASLRAYLDRVFTYANTVSVARDSSTPARAEARAGDFFVQGGFPGHAVMILAIAKGGGHTFALLGQSYMPAQNFQVLAHDGDPWFSLDGDSIETPFWRPFTWPDLRRLP